MSPKMQKRLKQDNSRNSFYGAMGVLFVPMLVCLLTSAYLELKYSFFDDFKEVIRDFKPLFNFFKKILFIALFAYFVWHFWLKEF